MNGLSLSLISLLAIMIDSSLILFAIPALLGLLVFQHPLSRLAEKAITPFTVAVVIYTVAAFAVAWATVFN